MSSQLGPDQLGPDKCLGSGAVTHIVASNDAAQAVHRGMHRTKPPLFRAGAVDCISIVCLGNGGGFDAVRGRRVPGSGRGKSLSYCPQSSVDRAQGDLWVISGFVMIHV